MIDDINQELQELIQIGTKKKRAAKSAPIPIPKVEKQANAVPEPDQPAPVKPARKPNNWLNFLTEFRKENPTITPQKILYKQASIAYKQKK